MSINIDTLQDKLNYKFKNSQYLQLAFTHRSYSKKSYERLEFLGDNVLGLIISEYLYNTYPNIKEGKLSRIRANLVCTPTLSKISKNLGLIDYICVGNSQNSKSLPDSIHADLVESAIGAIYLDSNLETCRQIILLWFVDIFEKLDPNDGFKDAKTRLQEWLQARNYDLPVYELVKMSGVEHKQIFYISCRVECTEEKTIGSGQNRRIGEQNAAELMLNILNNNEISE